MVLHCHCADTGYQEMKWKVALDARPEDTHRKCRSGVVL